MLAQLHAFRHRAVIVASAVVAVLLAAAVAPALAQQGAATDDGVTQDFHLDRCTWDDSGQNLFFSLIPGTRSVHQGEEDGAPAKLVTTVLNQERHVTGVPTRVLEERHFADGELEEVSRNFYSICRETNSVFYFGEEVDFYENGEITGHEGAWLAGENGAKPGLYMPALPLLGARYYQEIAPDVALDQAEVISVTDHVDTPAGSFDGCLTTRETTVLEPGAVDIKVFCPDVGIADDAGLLLVSFTPGQVQDDDDDEGDHDDQDHDGDHHGHTNHADDEQGDDSD